MNPSLITDFYKIGHIDQYAPGVQTIFSNWTPRKIREPLASRTNKVVVFGLQHFLMKHFIEAFNDDFFRLPKEIVINEYRNVIRQTLGIKNPRTDHFEKLHDLGYLPLAVYALPEGSRTSINVPHFVVYNTSDDFFWLPNFFETVISTEIWQASTSATIALAYREILTKWAKKAGEDDLSFIDYQAHDFSMRGMGGLGSAVNSGMGHLTSFKGTDTIPSLLDAQKYYKLPLTVSSVPASEHSIACSYTDTNEIEYFRRLLTDVYPNGLVSLVSDTWDLWKILTEFVPQLKNAIEVRDGKVVFRPDSGNPEHILCGEPLIDYYQVLVKDSIYDENNLPNYPNILNKVHPKYYGVLRILAHVMGTTIDRGSKLPMLNKVGAIYGDAITLDVADNILRRVVEELELSPFNVVLGVGSYTYQYNTRDTLGFAMKATAMKRNGEIVPMFKDPITDSGLKKSRKGILAVYESEFAGEYIVKENATLEELQNCAFNLVFMNGEMRYTQTMDEIRERLNPKESV